MAQDFSERWAIAAYAVVIRLIGRLLSDIDVQGLRWLRKGEAGLGYLSRLLKKCLAKPSVLECGDLSPLFSGSAREIFSICGL